MKFAGKAEKVCLRGESREARRYGRAILGLGKSKERGPGRKKKKGQLEVGGGKNQRRGGDEVRTGGKGTIHTVAGSLMPSERASFELF